MRWGSKSRNRWVPDGAIHGRDRGYARFGVGRWLPKLHDSGRGGDTGTYARDGILNRRFDDSSGHKIYDLCAWLFHYLLFIICSDQQHKIVIEPH